MKITAQFDYLYTGESNSRTLYLERDEKYADKNICLGFVTPLGRLYITDPILFIGNSCEYFIPEGLLDGRGKLFIQLIATEGEEYVAKSKLYEYSVFASVDDLSLPEASAEDVKSIAVLFEMIKKKADEGHQHDDRYYTEEETDRLLDEKSDSTHQHSWEEIKGRPGEVSLVKQCTLVLTDVYELMPNHYTCALTVPYGDIKSGTDARVTVRLSDGSTYEAVLEVQDDGEGTPFISFNNDLKTEDFINGNASLKVTPVDDSIPAFVALFYPNGEFCEVFLPEGEYEGAEIEICTEDVVKLSSKAFETVNSAVEGSKTLITSGGVKKELDKLSDREHSHDDRYYTEEEVDTLLSGKSDTGHAHEEYLTEDDLPAPPVIPEKVSQFQNDAGYVTIEHNHDGRYYTEEEIDGKLSDLGKAEHDHDGRYYTEAETDKLLDGKSDSTHQHSWEEIKGRPGEVGAAKQCSLVLADVYEIMPNHYTCNMTGDYSGIKSGMIADVGISLSGGGTYEAGLEVQDADGQPFISFNNDLTTEDFAGGNASLKVNPVDDSVPAFVVLFYPEDDFCEVFLPEGEYEGAVIDIYAEDIVKLSAKAFESVDVAVEGSSALITSGGAKKELDKKSDTGHSHDDRYYTEEEIDKKLSDVGKAEHDHDSRYYTEEEVNTLLSVKSNTGHKHEEYLTEADLPAAPEIPTKVSQLQNDAGYVDSNHNHDGRYYTENEVNTLLSGKSNTGHAHEEYLTEDDLPAIPVIPKKVSELQNDSGYVDSNHNHDSRYYTAEEIDSKLTGVDVSGHNHDDRYYTEAETDELLGSHQHSWEEIDGRPGGVSYTKQCGFVLNDVYEAGTDFYTCYLTGVDGNIISGMTVRVTISLVGKGTYEDILEVQNDDGGYPFISFNNDLKTEDFINGTASVKVSPIDDSLPAFIALFYPNGSCEVFMPEDGYEGAVIDISSGGLVKLSNEALYTADSAVAGSSALLTSGGAKTELDKKSDIGHNHDDAYMPKEFVITGVLDMANGTITGASASFSEISEAVDAGLSVSLKIDCSSAAGAGAYMSAHYLMKTDNAHVFDVVTDFGGPALIRTMCLASDSWVVTLSPIASITTLQDYYSKNEVNTLLGGKSDTGHAHSYLALSDIPTIHNNIPFAGNITTNDLIYKGHLTSDNNLNEVFDDGVYTYFSSSLPKNAPFMSDTIVEVFGSRNNTGQKIQRAYRSDEEGHSAFRPFNDNSWLSWSYPSVTTEKTVTGTTSAEGALSLGLSSSEYIVLSAYCASYICIPYRSASGEWVVKVVNGNTMTPVTSAAVEIICFYTKRIKE